MSNTVVSLCCIAFGIPMFATGARIRFRDEPTPSAWDWIDTAHGHSGLTTGDRFAPLAYMPAGAAIVLLGVSFWSTSYEMWLTFVALIGVCVLIGFWCVYRRPAWILPRWWDDVDDLARVGARDQRHETAQARVDGPSADTRRLALEALEQAVADVRSGRDITARCPSCGGRVQLMDASGGDPPVSFEFACDCGMFTTSLRGI